MSKKYPRQRAIEMAKGITKSCREKYPASFCDNNYHNWEYLMEFSKQLGVHLVFDRQLPGGTRKAAVLFVEGHPFIIIDKSIRPRSQKSVLTLAHELGHVVLHHSKRFSFAFHGYSESTDPENEKLQYLYKCEVELEANIAAMLLVLPDGYLDKLVDKHIFIPTRAKSEQHNIPFEWFAARVELYREIYGYEKSKKLLAQRLHKANSDDYSFSNPSIDKWMKREGGKCNHLEAYLPEMKDKKFAPHEGLY